MKPSNQNLQPKLQLSSAKSSSISDISENEIEALADKTKQSICSNLDLLIKELPQVSKIGIAVSGGSDSLGLMIVVIQWANDKNIELSALTIDHGLREAAALEANYVKELCQVLGIKHSTLKWTPGNSKTISQDTARQARHRLFCAWSKQQNINALLLGHTLDDRLETMLIRQNAGSSDYGLAAMPSLSASPIWPEGQNLHLLRPAYSLNRQDLQAVLHSKNIQWVYDPSNENEVYERVRIRNFLNSQSRTERLQSALHLATFTATRTHTNRELKNFLASNAQWNDDGSVKISLSNLKKIDPTLIIRSLERVLLCVSGAKQSVSLARVEALFNAAISSNSPTKQTLCLGGCWIITEGTTLTIYAMPEKRAKTRNAPRSQRLTLSPNESSYFQNRFEVQLSANIPNVELVTWDEANIYGLKPPSPSNDKKARRSMPIAIQRSNTKTSPICIDEGKYRVKALHHLRHLHLSKEIFL